MEHIDIIEKLYNIGHKPIVFMSETNQKKSVSIKSVYLCTGVKFNYASEGFKNDEKYNFT